MTEDVLSVLFRRCVPSFRYTRDPCANHSSHQVLGTAICTSRRVFSSQCCRSAGEIDSNLVRGTPTGRNGQGKVGWVYFGEGLGHVRLIHSVFLRFMTSPAPNHSIILHSENAMAGGLQNGGIYKVSTYRRIERLPTLVFREDRVVQLVKRSKLFLVNKIELS